MITREQFKQEDRRVRELRRQGKSEDYIKSWRRGWRMVSPTQRSKKQ